MFRNNYMEFHINLKSVIIIEMETDNNESTAGADASVEMPKLHNIKLLIA